MTKAILPNGIVTDYQHNANSWLKVISAIKGVATIASIDHSFDKVGNITSKATDIGNFAYGYDLIYQLTAASHPRLPSETYTYDNVGNRMTSTSTSGTWSYNANNQLTGYDNAVYIHGPNGNITQKTENGQVVKYLFNSSDRLETLNYPG